MGREGVLLVVWVGGWGRRSGWGMGHRRGALGVMDGNRVLLGTCRGTAEAEKASWHQ